MSELYTEQLQEHLRVFEKELPAHLPAAEGLCETVARAMTYACEAGGKRIRPVLTLEFCRLACGDAGRAMPFATAVELIHSYSLVHDDLPCMDDSPLRRGKPSVHAAFGEDMALLAGDALLTLAFEVMLRADNRQAIPAESVLAAAFTLAKRAGYAGMVGGQVIVGRIKGVERPPLAPLIPTEKGFSLLIDCGANVDARPSHLVQFAQMGSIYMEHVMGVKRPRVAIVNIGAEEEKGNALVKETFPLLKECPGINFIGSIEAREIPHGGADVIVCEAFAGNVILKLYEGVGATMISMIKKGMMSSLRSKIGALLIKPALKSTLKSFDVSQYGGAPLLGLKGLVVKTHGSSKANEVKNSIIQCIAFKEQAISEKIGQCLSPKEEDIKEP